MRKFFLLSFGFLAITFNSASQIKLLPIMTQDEIDAGLQPGDHEQFMLDFTYSDANPDRIYAGQDVSGVWVSKDGGKFWNNLRNRGLHAPGIISIEADPLDENRVLTAAYSRYYDDTHQDYQGIYLTKDGGLNWNRVAIRSKLGEIRAATKLIAYAPSTKSIALGYATRWYAAFSEYRKEATPADSDNADDGLLMSDDGGETWSEIRELPQATFGTSIHGIKIDPLNENKLYLYGVDGLFKLDNANTSGGQVTNVSGVGGLPAGSVYGKVYISSDAQTLIVPVASKGLYKSTDGGTTWSPLYFWSNLELAYYNEGYPDVIYIVGVNGSQGQVRATINGGTTFYNYTSSEGRLGNKFSEWTYGISSRFANIIPDPRNPDRAFAQGHAVFHQTDDAGKNWIDSSDGFNGTHYNGISLGQMFDSTDENKFAYFCLDRGVMTTNDGGITFKESTVKDFLPSGYRTTVYGSAICPSNSNIILASVNTTSSGRLVRSTDFGVTWELSIDELKQRHFVGFNPQSPQYAYQYRDISDDYGETWTTLSNIPINTTICGMAPSNGDIIYALDNLGASRNVYRSLDKGETWTPVIINNAWKLNVPSGARNYLFVVHPTNPDIFYTNSATGTITEWNLSTDTDKDIAPIEAAAEVGFYVNRFTIDPRYPNIMYMLNQRVNTGNKLFISQDAGDTWTNISDGFPNTFHNGLAVSPITGEVFLAGPNGSRVLLPPYDTDRSKTSYDKVDYDDNYIDETSDYALSTEDFKIKDVNKIFIYPNPSNNDLFVSGLNEDTSVNIYNITGQHITTHELTANSNEIKVSNLVNGIYFIKIKQYTYQFIKQ
ncbi:Por secretion system C-terminal sorting domain-containing protein [Flaviramulus basaltis]|uniref:Por secretion system C-terminal sorting domain-containing protein n=1 Tax=Flaviramulus basaltis TaxID=369401 RepID=A0A1K2IMB2_9FLAO|nr:T9SS type A sorting domain-containing protein [Flaviramulus basaltis]SFZ93605.1 Por secretion system C-terminal sorting domain-containing protein [Flaviramulus basaltis]